VPPTVSRKVPRSWRCHQAAADFSKVIPSPNHRHFPESSAVLNELLICQNRIHFPVIHEIVSLEWSSTSWCFCKVGFISKSWRDWLQASICWQMSACYAPDRWLVPSVGDSGFFMSVTQTLFIDVKWIGNELVSQLNDTCLGQAPLYLRCLVAHMQACVRCMNASTELVCMVCQKLLSSWRRIAEHHRVRTAGCFLLLWTNSLLDAFAS